MKVNIQKRIVSFALALCLVALCVSAFIGSASAYHGLDGNLIFGISPTASVKNGSSLKVTAASETTSPVFTVTNTASTSSTGTIILRYPYVGILPGSGVFTLEFSVNGTYTSLTPYVGVTASQLSSPGSTVSKGFNSIDFPCSLVPSRISWFDISFSVVVPANYSFYVQPLSLTFNAPDTSLSNITLRNNYLSSSGKWFSANFKNGSSTTCADDSILSLNEPPVRLGQSIERYSLANPVRTTQYSTLYGLIQPVNAKASVITYWCVSLDLPGSVIYLDVGTSSTAVSNDTSDTSIPFQCSYFRADSVLSVDTASSLTAYEISGQEYVPVGGSIHGGLIAVQPEGSANINYAFSNDYNHLGSGGSTEFGIDYGYRDGYTYALDDYESSAYSSLIPRSSLSLSFVLPANSIPIIHYACIDDSYTYAGAEYSSTGGVIVNPTANTIRCTMSRSSEPLATMVSYDTSYLASLMGKNHDETIALLQKFFPSVATVAQINEVTNKYQEVSQSGGRYFDYASEELEQSLARVPSVSSLFSGSLATLSFIKTYADKIYTAVGPASGLIVAPLIFGILIFCLLRAPGATHLFDHHDSPNKNDES